MTIKPLAGTQPLKTTILQKVNSRLLAKSIAELMHEAVAQPAIISTEKDGRTNFLLSTDQVHLYYTFSGYKRRLDYWHLEVNSLQRHQNGQTTAATDAPLFFVEMQQTFGI